MSKHALVVRVDGHTCRIRTPDGEEITVDHPGAAVGDLFDQTELTLLPRRSELARRDPSGTRQVLAANVELVVIVEPLGRPVTPTNSCSRGTRVPSRWSCSPRATSAHRPTIWEHSASKFSPSTRDTATCTIWLQGSPWQRSSSGAATSPHNHRPSPHAKLEAVKGRVRIRWRPRRRWDRACATCAARPSRSTRSAETVPRGTSAGTPPAPTPAGLCSRR